MPKTKVKGLKRVEFAQGQKNNSRAKKTASALVTKKENIFFIRKFPSWTLRVRSRSPAPKFPHNFNTSSCSLAFFQPKLKVAKTDPCCRRTRPRSVCCENSDGNAIVPSKTTQHANTLKSGWQNKMPSDLTSVAQRRKRLNRLDGG